MQSTKNKPFSIVKKIIAPIQIGSDTLYFTISNVDAIGVQVFVTSLVVSNVSISVKAEQLLTSVEAIEAFKKAGNIVKEYTSPQG